MSSNLVFYRWSKKYRNAVEFAWLTNFHHEKVKLSRYPFLVQTTIARNKFALGIKIMSFRQEKTLVPQKTSKNIGYSKKILVSSVDKNAKKTPKNEWQYEISEMCGKHPGYWQEKQHSLYLSYIFSILYLVHK